MRGVSQQPARDRGFDFRGEIQPDSARTGAAGKNLNKQTNKKKQYSSGNTDDKDNDNNDNGSNRNTENYIKRMKRLERENVSESI